MRTGKNLGNRIMMVLMAAMVFVTGAGVSKTAFAANTSDESWSFYLTTDNTSLQYIPGRNKTDDSKIYINWTTKHSGGLTSIIVSPYGADSAYGDPKPAGTYTGGVKSYIMNGYGQYSITNYVFERELAYARPGMRAEAGYATAVGVWSPDSTRNYTILN